MNRKIAYKLLTIVFVVILTLCMITAVSRAGDGALVVLDAPSYPYRLWVWEDGKGGGLTVAVAMRSNIGFPYAIPEPGDPRTLDDAVEIFLPDTARKFTPDYGFPIPDTIKVSATDVPVAVFEATESQIYNAYVDPDNPENQGVLEDTIIASGFVKAQWSGKAFKATSVHAIGRVSLIDGGEAILVATGHELYDNPYEDPYSSFFKVELH